jgi:hypothetical protein
VILRALDRRAGRAICKTLGSTDIIASERVTLGNFGAMDGAAKSIGDAAGLAFTDALAWEESSIKRPLRTGPPIDSKPIVDRRAPRTIAQFCVLSGA